VADFDPRTPSIARAYDYLLDGKDHFAADREVAARAPPAPRRPGHRRRRPHWLGNHQPSSKGTTSSPEPHDRPATRAIME
jgi:S-adenosyl methyltransferase